MIITDNEGKSKGWEKLFYYLCVFNIAVRTKEYAQRPKQKAYPSSMEWKR